VITGREAFGGSFTFIAGVAREDLVTDAAGRRALDALREALVIAMDLLADPTDELLQELAGLYGVPPDRLSGYLEDPELVYTAEIAGVPEFASAMVRLGYLAGEPDGPALRPVDLTESR
jgi:NitT/TauT family transport system substrate-binding protein